MRALFDIVRVLIKGVLVCDQVETLEARLVLVDSLRAYTHPKEISAADLQTIELLKGRP